MLESPVARASFYREKRLLTSPSVMNNGSCCSSGITDE